jgi:hypothetical protein
MQDCRLSMTMKSTCLVWISRCCEDRMVGDRHVTFFALDRFVSIYKTKNPKLLYVLRANMQISLNHKHACAQKSTPDIGVDVPDLVIIGISSLLASV